MLVGRRGLRYIKVAAWPPALRTHTVLCLLFPLTPRPSSKLCLSPRPQPHLGFLLQGGLALCLSLSLFPSQTDSTPCLKRVVIWRFSFLYSFKKKIIMFSCQPGRQTACIILSHAKDPFKAAIICSGCLILWGQWEGP